MGLFDKYSEPRSCCCVGPQNGQPLCPCRMRGVHVRDGRYIRTEDLGPVPTPSSALDVLKEKKCRKCGATHFDKPKFCSACGAAQ